MSVIVFILAGLYTGTLSFGRIGVALIASAFEYQLPESTPFALAAGQGILLLVPLAFLAYFWREPRYAGIYRAWTAAAGLVLLLAPIHFSRPYLAQQHAVLHILLTWLYILLLWFIARRQGRSTEAALLPAGLDRRTAVFLALAASGLFAYPWLAWGALGSLLDTLLQTLAALSIGIAAALIVETGLLYGFRRGRTAGQSALDGPGDLFLAGLGAATVLLILASAAAFGYGGMQLMLMLCLPSLGWVMIRLSRARGRPGMRLSGASLPMGLLVGAAAAAPMTLVDPSELHFLTSAYAGEIFQVALSAAGLSALLGLLLSVLVLIAFARESRRDGARLEKFRSHLNLPQGWSRSHGSWEGSFTWPLGSRVFMVRACSSS